MRSGEEPKHHLVIHIIVVDLDVLCMFVKGRVANYEDGSLVQFMGIEEGGVMENSLS